MREYHRSLRSRLVLRAAALGLLLLMALAFSQNATAQTLPRMHPMLAQLASERPDQTISIIVQKTTAGANVAERIAALGGQVTADLYIINALGAELKAKDVPQLAKADGVNWIWYDAPVVSTACPPTCPVTTSTIAPSTALGGNLQSAYPKEVGAVSVWNESRGQNMGQGIGVAVIDSGVMPHPDFGSRLLGSTTYKEDLKGPVDLYGHGTHVAGIIGGDGSASNGNYMGIAPKANIINVKVSNEDGQSSAINVLLGMQWVIENRVKYNIRVANLSLNSNVAASYHKDALDAGVEYLWFNKIVVVVSAGNKGRNELFPPANDPFVITVGAVDDHNTPAYADDSIATFSGVGTTVDGFHKPDLFAPGVNIMSTLASKDAKVAKEHSDHINTKSPLYFRMSGTSMAAPVVAGTVALMLQAQPSLTPDQVKQCLKTTAAMTNQTGALGIVNVGAAVHCNGMGSANVGVPASNLLIQVAQAAGAVTGPVNWSSVNWSSVNWSSVNWSSVNWSSVNWSSVNWSSVNWSSVDWS